MFQLNIPSIVGIGEAEHLPTHALTECLKTRREKYAVPPDVALERRTKRVIPGFRPVRSLLDAVGPSLLSATDFASRYGIEGGICRPLNHMRQIPRLLTAPNRPCHYNLTSDFDGLYIQEKSYFICHMVSTGVADYKVHACALPKVTYMHAE